MLALQLVALLIINLVVGSWFPAPLRCLLDWTWTLLSCGTLLNAEGSKPRTPLGSAIFRGVEHIVVEQLIVDYHWLWHLLIVGSCRSFDFADRGVLLIVDCSAFVDCSIRHGPYSIVDRTPSWTVLHRGRSFSVDATSS